MHLTFVVNKITGRGGTETVLVKVLNDLAQDDNEIRLVLSNLTPSKEWLTQLDKSIKIAYPRNSSKVARLFYFTRIFINGPKNETYIVLSQNIIKLFAKLRKLTHKKCKIVSWFHFSIANQKVYDPDNIVYADYHLAISSAIKNQMVDLGIAPQKIFLILNPAEHHQSIENKKYDKIPHLLYVGRIQKQGQKNLQELFHAVSLVEFPMILDVYGSGKDEQACRQLCHELRIDNKVVWHGWADNVWDELVYRPFAIILTSKFEGLPMVFLEAISRGIPCISANFDGYDDVISDGQNGTYYQLGNIQQCANRIRETTETNYDVKAVQASISKFYEEKYFSHLKKVLQKITSY